MNTFYEGLTAVISSTIFRELSQMSDKKLVSHVTAAKVWSIH